MYVVDTSFAVAWFLPDESNAVADALLEKLNIEPASAPSLFWFEMRNVLIVAERRRRLQDVTLVLDRLRRLPIRDEGLGSDLLVVTLAKRHGLTAYDASYLALAKQRSFTLVTDDRRLGSAARQDGLTVLCSRDQ